MRRVLLFALLIACTNLVVPDAAGRVPDALDVQQMATDAAQPEGWDRDLALQQPVDMNPAPDVLEFALEARLAEIEIRPGVKTQAWTYNGILPGPYIRVKVGDTVIIHFTNSLPEATTIHWHGVRVPNNMDGAPGMTQDPIAPGASFRYEFVVRDAGTYWYHPHSNSAAQVGWGLYGPILVEDPADPAIFGDDLVLMLSDMSLDGNDALLPQDNGGAFGDLFGREGNVVLVNGKIRPRLKVRAGKPQRWRIINAARARYFSLAARSSSFVRLGGDNGLAAQSERLLRPLLVPGERLDMVFTSSAAPGAVSALRWLPFDRGYGTAFGRTAEDIMDIETVDAPAVKSAAIPEILREIPVVDVSQATHHTLDLTIDKDQTTVEMGINGVPASRATPIHARIGDKHVWTLTNSSPFDHPFHLHGYFFQVLDDDRIREWKDTVNVPVKATVRIAIDFDERPGMWMYHCHILDHAEVGMMGHLHVQ